MSGTTSISENGLRMIERFEGGMSSDGLFHAYWDPNGRVWTIGFGETSGVHAGMTWTLAQAQAELKSSVTRNYAPSINALDVPLNPNEFDALCSFVWNLGPGSMQWDVGRDLRARNYTAAANAMLAYDRSGGQVLAGLASRRHDERALFLTPYTEPDPHHYGWYDRTLRADVGTSEYEAALAYDRWRRQQTLHLHPHRAQLDHAKEQCSVLSSRLLTEMEENPKDSPQLDHRDWRRIELDHRAEGRLVVP